MLAILLAVSLVLALVQAQRLPQCAVCPSCSTVLSANIRLMDNLPIILGLVFGRLEQPRSSVFRGVYNAIDHL